MSAQAHVRTGACASMGAGMLERGWGERLYIRLRLAQADVRGGGRREELRGGGGGGWLDEPLSEEPQNEGLAVSLTRPFEWWVARECCPELIEAQAWLAGLSLGVPGA